MKKRLNNKGMTAIEILLCFTITIVIVISMFKTISNYKDKEDIESYKSTITTYKNTVTKSIQDDIINNGGITKLEEKSSTDTSESYNITMKTGVVRNFSIVKNPTYTDSTHNIVDEKNSSFSISYAGEVFELPKVYGLQFNKVLITEDKYGFFHLYVGIYQPDLGVGDKYSVLDIITPDISAYNYALGA